MTLNGHVHIGHWVGPTNGQGALNKENISCPLPEIKPPIVLTTSNHYTYDDSCERGNEPLDSTKELVKQDSVTGSQSDMLVSLFVINCEISGFHRGVTEDLYLLRCDSEWFTASHSGTHSGTVLWNG